MPILQIKDWNFEGQGRNSLVIQRLGLLAFTAEGVSSIPGGETKILKVHDVAKKRKSTKKEGQGKVILLRPQNTSNVIGTVPLHK